MKKSTPSSTAEIFVDTSGFFALVVREDRAHERAQAVLTRAKARGRRFVTTDYVLDETATLLRARSAHRVVSTLFDVVFASKVCRVIWMDSEAFDQARDLFVRHDDKKWSFTDCVSFCVMHRLGLRDSLTTDKHFRQARFVALLAE